MEKSVYIIRNNITGKMYVGSTERPIRHRIHEHEMLLKRGKHYSKVMQDDFNKYGWNSFSYLVICKSIDGVAEEMKLIDFMQSYNPKFGYNKNVRKLGDIYGIHETGNENS